MSGDDNIRVQVMVFFVAVAALIIVAVTVGVTDPQGATKTLIPGKMYACTCGGLGA